MGILSSSFSVVVLQDTTKIVDDKHEKNLGTKVFTDNALEFELRLVAAAAASVGGSRTQFPTFSRLLRPHTATRNVFPIK